MMTVFEADQQTLAQPITIRHRRVRNRLVVAPMCTNYAAPDGSSTRELVAYYRARGHGGAGIIITEIAFIDDRGSRGFLAQLGAHHDRMIPGLADLAEAMREGGALAGLQIGHCGGQRGLSEPPLVSASAIPWAPGKPVPKAMTLREIDEVVGAFAAAAGRARAAGFDLVEVHAAHGYLVNAFLSPALNKRRDRYGGTFERRTGFAVEVARAIRSAIGPELLLSFRINGDDLLENGLDSRDYQRIAPRLIKAGVDILHVSAGTYRAMIRRVSPIYLAQGPFVPLIESIKRVVTAPVIASDTIHDRELAAGLIQSGKADLVSMARPNFADPDLPAKLLDQNSESIIPCIRCNTCVAREQGGKRAYCAVNPRTGHELESVMPAGQIKRVLVIGAGPAGISAALAAAKRGHRVTLVEREKLIGGQVAISAALPFKKPLARLVAHFETALKAATIRVATGCKIDPSSPLIAEHDVIVWATGPKWLPGSDNGGVVVVDPLAALALERIAKRKVVVVGATMTGAEVAWSLALKGANVVLIERRPNFGDDVNLIYRLELTDRLKEAGVTVDFETEALLSDTGATTFRSGKHARHRAMDYAADVIVLACGAREAEPPDSPATSTAKSAKTANKPTFRIGECGGQWGLMAAIHGGDRLGLSL